MTGVQKYMQVCLLTLFLTLSGDRSYSSEAPDFIKNWQVLGPFLSAPQEGAVDHLFFDGGEEKISPDERPYLSVLAPSGSLHWIKTDAESSQVKVKLQNIDWSLMKNFGGSAAVASQTYFYAEVDRPAAGTLLVNTQKVGEFFVNGERYFGEPYEFGFNKVPVRFQKGKNKVLLKVSSYEDPEFLFSLEIPSSKIQIIDDITAPDLSPIEKLSPGWLGIPVLNSTDDWIRNIRIELGGPAAFKKTTEEMKFPLPPLSVLKIPIQITQREDAKSDTLLHLKIYSDSALLTEKDIVLRFRDPKKGEGISKTFLSKYDRSAQYFSYLLPKNFDSQRSYDLLTYLHGANVEAKLLTDHFAPKDWGYVLAPTNRRPHGFAYQDLGRLDVLEAIEVFKKDHRINENGVFLGGHSMGGQGTWHIGLHHPAVFAGLAPSAGWTSFQLYTPFVYQKAALHLSPKISAIKDRMVLDSNNPFFVRNAEYLPVYISQANKDEVVPAFHSRLFYSLAKNLNMRVEYREVDSKEHWFQLPLNEQRGFDSMDHREQYDFLLKNRANPLPREVNFTLVDLGIERDFYWVRVESQENIFSETAVSASVSGETIKLRTSNVNSITLSLPDELLNSTKANIDWNEAKVSLDIPKSRKITLSSSGGKIRSINTASVPNSRQHALRSAFLNPYIIVYGGSGSNADTETLLQNARLLSHKAWRTANAFAPILSDKEITPEMIQNYNLILIGGPERNALVKRWTERLPIKLGAADVRFSDQKLISPTTGLAAAFVFPNPDAPSHLLAVFGGTDSSAEKFAPYFQPFYDRLGYGAPDFLIYSEAVKASGWGGVAAAGFFSKNWDLSNRDFAKR